MLHKRQDIINVDAMQIWKPERNDTREEENALEKLSKKREKKG